MSEPPIIMETSQHDSKAMANTNIVWYSAAEKVLFGYFNALPWDLCYLSSIRS